jgi:PAS domain S-box-containing protein
MPMPNDFTARKRTHVVARADDQPRLIQEAERLPEQSLRSSQARLAGILDIADDAIISIDNQQQITLFNQGAEKIFGYTAPEVLGQPIDLLLPRRFERIHQQHVIEFAGSADTARRMGERQDIYGLRKDGTEFPAEASISRLELAGQITFTVILRDITARKRSEQMLREQNLALERANQAKDRFLANMSHELRTPLNAVIGFTGTMLMRLPGPLTDAQERQLTIVQSSAKHLLALINDLLDLAKIESGKVELLLAPVALCEVIDEVAANLRPLAESKGLQFEIPTPAPDLVVRTDRRALSQILLNLLNNAIKFTDRGQVHLQAEARRMATVIRISDTGIGIRPEQQRHLFEAYVQGVDSSAQSREGTGLGLYLSQKLAGLLGGVIEFESEFGQGSTFSLVIPESREAAGTLAADEHQSG